MARRYNQRKKIYKQIATKRIYQLAQLAEQRALANQLDLADRYVFLARKLSMRYLVPLPLDLKRRICKHCYSYLLPGRTCRVRIHRSMLISYCINCKHYTRIPLKRYNKIGK